MTINPSHDTGIVGKMFTLNCTVDISPPEDVVSSLTLEWLYGLTNISLPSQTNVMESNPSRITYINTLHFSPLQQSHKGIYTCHIGGNERLVANTTVKVKGKLHDNFTAKRHLVHLFVLLDSFEFY